MICSNCDFKSVESQSQRAFYPIEPKGTPNRKWNCEECISEENFYKIPKDVQELVRILKG